MTKIDINDPNWEFKDDTEEDARERQIDDERRVEKERDEHFAPSEGRDY